MDNLLNATLSVPTTAEMVDEIAIQDAIIAGAEKRRKELCAALLACAGDDKYIDGHLHTATIVAESMQWRLDNTRIKEQMGEEWVAKFSNFSMRKAYIKVTARKERA